MTTLDSAASVEIERLKEDIEHAYSEKISLELRLLESERQRKLLAEHLKRLGVGGVEAATGAGK